MKELVLSELRKNYTVTERDTGEYHLLKKSGIFGCVAVSVVGGVLHNLGQILVAWAIMGPNVIYYLPVLLLSGTVTGVLIGLASGLLASRTDLKL